MDDLNWLFKITDSYDRKAKLLPAFVALMPVLAIYGFNFNVKIGVFGGLTIFVAFSLLQSIVRHLGKSRQGSLYESWGGKPTTQILRHRNDEIDPVTKTRYHSLLSGKIGVKFPSASDERNNEAGADEIYQSGINWLLENTRDTKRFHILFKELTSYGFHRNCLPLKWWVIAICFASILWTLFIQKVFSLRGADLKAFASMPNTAWLSLAISILMVLIWLTFLTKSKTKEAAFTYASALLKACDAL